MKINELLQKIVNGEVVPDKIKFNECTYVFAGDDYSVDDEREEWLFSDGYTKFNMWLKEFLDEEVEIIEEDKKIEKLNKMHFHKKQRQLANKINEIIEIKQEYTSKGKLQNYLNYQGKIYHLSIPQVVLFKEIKKIQNKLIK